MEKHLGIDVSSNNGELDWESIKKSGVEFAMIRIGYGSNIIKQDDEQAVRNMQECARLGIPYGVYLYSYALNAVDAASEVGHALRIIKGFNPELGVWFDMEDADGYKSRHGIDVYKSRELLTDICRIFCEGVIAAGYLTGVYANKNYWDNVLLKDELAKYPVWLAHWGIDEASMPCLLWQYTSDGEVPGSSARTDMNYYYGDIPAVKVDDVKDHEVGKEQQQEYFAEGQKVRVLKAEQYEGGSFMAYHDAYDVIQTSGDRIVIGIGGVVTAAVHASNLQAVDEETNTPAGGCRTYTVAKGDTLWNIADKELGNGSRYTEIMELSGLTDTTIYLGQVLTLPEN